jgi:hypothetical protein
MSQFYAKAEDEERCLQSSITRYSVMVQGRTTEGKHRRALSSPKMVGCKAQDQNNQNTDSDVVENGHDVARQWPAYVPSARRSPRDCVNDLQRTEKTRLRRVSVNYQNSK